MSHLLRAVLSLCHTSRRLLVQFPQRRRVGGYLGLILLLVGACVAVFAQDELQISISAQQLERDVIDNEPCTRLVGDVVLVLKECTIKADNAIYHTEKKLVEVRGHVKIIYTSGPTVEADQLWYDSKTHLAKLRGNVVYTSGSMTLHTDYFDHNTATKQGYFLGGGKLVEGTNILTSASGQYNDQDKTAVFEKDVTLVSKDYTLRCDRLRYNTVTKIAYFQGDTEIVSNDGKNRLETQEGGEYNTSSQQSTFVQSKVETDAYTLYGDLLRVDQATAVYTVTGHVKLVAKAEEVTIWGDHGQYQKGKGVAEISGNTLMMKALEEDALYLTADTFVAQESRLDDERVNTTVSAHHNVKLYQEDFQGKADSMVYHSARAIVYFYGDPILWSHKNQLTADKISLSFEGKAFSEMHMQEHACIASQGVASNHDQLRGRDMVAFFKKNKLDYIEVDGNAESIYFVVDDNGQLQGMNHLRCSQVRISIENGEIASMTFQVEPVGIFYPPSELMKTSTSKVLGNFVWRGDERPSKEEVIARGYGTRRNYKSFKFNRQN